MYAATLVVKDHEFASFWQKLRKLLLIELNVSFLG